MANVHPNVISPGTYLGEEGKDIHAGKGTYVDDEKKIRATVSGEVIVEEASVNSLQRKLVHVISACNVARDYVLDTGDLVYGRVLKTNYNQAVIEIISTGDLRLQIPSKGVIRKEDVRTVDIDKVVVPEVFKVGNVVSAKVLTLGDSKYYFLSTAETGLGVVPRPILR